MNPASWITTSWDDGHPLDLRLAELLHKHSIPATFYVPRRAPGGVIADAQLRELAQSFEIGAHTLDHVYLTQVDDARALRQIADSKAWIEDTAGRPCTMFCPPAGKYTAAHARIARECGYAGLRSVELLSLDTPRNRDGLLIMPTTLQAHPHRLSAYLKNAVKRGAWSNLWQCVTHGSPNDWERLAVAFLNRLACSGGVLHLWGHSWELEHNSQWHRLDRVLALLSSNTSATRASNGGLCTEVFTPATRLAQETLGNHREH